MSLNAVRILFVAAYFVFMLGNLGENAAAQEQAAEKSATAATTGGVKKKTSIDFEDELIEGELKKPELFYLLQKKQFNFKRLIKLREDFLPEMQRDAYTIKRGRSKN